MEQVTRRGSWLSVGLGSNRCPESESECLEPVYVGVLDSRVVVPRDRPLLPTAENKDVTEDGEEGRVYDLILLRFYLRIIIRIHKGLRNCLTDCGGCR